MPRKYKKRKPRKRRVRKAYQPLIAMGTPSGMQTFRYAKLRYASSFTMTSSSGILAKVQYRANSLFDPQETSGGHQPFGFDQWATLYNSYMVLGSKITVTWYDIGTVNTNPLTVGVYLSDSASLPYTTTDTFIEARKGQFRQYTGRAVKPVVTVSNFSAKKYFNLKDPKDNIKEYGALVDANPNEEAIFSLIVQSRNAGTESINATILIEYMAMFSEPKDIPSS